MNGDSELLHNDRGPTGLAYIDVAFFFLRANGIQLSGAFIYLITPSFLQDDLTQKD